MRKYLYIIRKLKIKPWLKYWLIKAGEIKGVLSEILTGTSFTLENSIERVFNKFDLKGNTLQDGTPSPENPIEIQNVSGNNNIKIQNKNLFDVNNETIIKRLNDSTVNVVNNTLQITKANSGLQERVTVYKQLKPNTTYTLSTNPMSVASQYAGPRLAAVDEISSSAYPSAIDSLTNTATTNSSGILAIIFTLLTAYTGTFTISEIQLEQGSTSSDYIEHAEQNLPINLKSKNVVYNTLLPRTAGGVDISYDATRDVYKFKNTATNNANAYIITYNVPIVSLNANESIELYIERVSGTSKVRFMCYFVPDDASATDYSYFVDLAQNQTGIERKVKTPTKSGKLMYVQFYIENGVTYDDEVRIMVSKTLNSTYEPYYNYELCKIGTAVDYFYKDEDKWYVHKEINKIDSYNGETITTEYMSTTGGLDTGATIYYILATPTNIEITETTLINQLEALRQARSYNEQTNISQTNNDLPFIIDLQYWMKEGE